MTDTTGKFENSGIDPKRLEQARAAVVLAGAFPVIGGDFVPIRRHSWFGEDSNNQKEENLPETK